VRDDFPKAVLETLAKRVGYRCSNPSCRKLTSGPHTDKTKALNVGAGRSHHRRFARRTSVQSIPQHQTEAVG
jgi:hypothetical protein